MKRSTPRKYKKSGGADPIQIGSSGLLSDADFGPLPLPDLKLDRKVLDQIQKMHKIYMEFMMDTSQLDDQLARCEVLYNKGDLGAMFDDICDTFNNPQLMKKIQVMMKTNTFPPIEKMEARPGSAKTGADKGQGGIASAGAQKKQVGGMRENSQVVPYTPDPAPPTIIYLPTRESVAGLRSGFLLEAGRFRERCAYLGRRAFSAFMRQIVFPGAGLLVLFAWGQLTDMILAWGGGGFSTESVAAMAMMLFSGVAGLLLCIGFAWLREQITQDMDERARLEGRRRRVNTDQDRGELVYYAGRDGGPADFTVGDPENPVGPPRWASQLPPGARCQAWTEERGP